MSAGGTGFNNYNNYAYTGDPEACGLGFNLGKVIGTTLTPIAGIRKRSDAPAIRTRINAFEIMNISKTPSMLLIVKDPTSIGEAAVWNNLSGSLQATVSGVSVTGGRIVYATFINEGRIVARIDTEPELNSFSDIDDLDGEYFACAQIVTSGTDTFHAGFNYREYIAI